MPQQLDKTRVIDYDEKYNTISATAGATSIVASLRLKPGKKPYLSFISNAVDVAGINYVTFKFQVNRGDFYPFDGSINQWAPPESNYDLPVPYELSVSSEVRVIVINTDASNAYNATARFKILYTDF